MIGHITLGMKYAGERSAGNPPAAFDVEGAGNVLQLADRCIGAPVLDPTGFGVAGRLLVQELHAWHAPPFLGSLDAIGQTDQARVDLKWAKQDKAQTHPARCQ